MEEIKAASIERGITVEELISQRVSAGIASDPMFMVGANDAVFNIRFRKDH
jgi:hypothetical protein